MRFGYQVAESGTTTFALLRSRLLPTAPSPKAPSLSLTRKALRYEPPRRSTTANPIFWSDAIEIDTSARVASWSGSMPSTRCA